MALHKFSQKQLQVLTWWHAKSKYAHCDGIICDGAVRSGKTFSLSVSFLLWSFSTFRNETFALCGKTIGSLQRNVIQPLMKQASTLGFQCNLIRSQNLLEVSVGGHTNKFYLFGGKDESSAGYIQGMTLAGVLFDEVVLMPRSFVEQSLARCSVEGAKFWFNCNPEHPAHWFYQEWIQKTTEKNIVYFHFLMSDNPSLSSAVLKRYDNLYQGVFHQRYVEGKWSESHGAIYPMFSYQHHVVEKIPSDCSRFLVSCDYGTTNPTSMGLWGYSPGTDCWYRICEFYHCSRTTGIVKTDEEYADHLEELVKDYSIEKIIVDPSAASFIQCLRNRGKFLVESANNKVFDGIQLVSNCLNNGKIKFHCSCKEIIREFSLYRWDLKTGKDVPFKEYDHAMDDMRYFAQSAFSTATGGFYAVSARRK